MFFSHNSSIHNLNNILEIERLRYQYKGSKDTVAIHYVGGVIKTLTFRDNKEIDDFCEELQLNLLENDLLLPLTSSTFIREDDEEDTQMEIPFK